MTTRVEWFRWPVIICNNFTTSISLVVQKGTKERRKGGRRQKFGVETYTNNSKGRVVKQLNPKQNLAKLTIPLSLGKLFSILPIVLSLKTRTPARAMMRHATRLNPVLKCVTVEKRSIVGFFNAP